MGYRHLVSLFSKRINFNRKELAQIKEEQVAHTHEHVDEVRSFWKNGWSALTHSIDEFFDTGRYLILVLCSACNPNWCTYAIRPFKDFSDSSHASHRCHSITLFRSGCIYWFFSLSLFGTGPIVAFLVFGPMVDIKNLLMMKRYFKMSFIVQFVLIVALVVTIYAAVV